MSLLCQETKACYDKKWDKLRERMRERDGETDGATETEKKETRRGGRERENRPEVRSSRFRVKIYCGIHVYKIFMV